MLGSEIKLESKLNEGSKFIFELDLEVQDVNTIDPSKFKYDFAICNVVEDTENIRDHLANIVKYYGRIHQGDDIDSCEKIDLIFCFGDPQFYERLKNRKEKFKCPVVFVGKKEMAKIPIFGFIYKRVCILVDRSNSKSRYQVFERAQNRIKQGLSICIFPEGGVPDDESVVLDSFKDGAFRIAIEHHLPIVPIVFFDNKKRLSYTFFSGSPGKMRAKILPIIETKGKTLEDRNTLKQQVRQLILSELENDLK